MYVSLNLKFKNPASQRVFCCSNHNASLPDLFSDNYYYDFCDYMDGGMEFNEILKILRIKKTSGYEYRKLYFKLLENRTYYYFRESKGYGLYPFNMVHENQLKYPYITFPEFK